jgi:hypothetical protein
MKLKLKRTLKRLDTLSAKLYKLESDKNIKTDKRAISDALSAVKTAHIKLTALKTTLVPFVAKKGAVKS